MFRTQETTQSSHTYYLSFKIKKFLFLKYNNTEQVDIYLTAETAAGSFIFTQQSGWNIIPAGQ